MESSNFRQSSIGGLSAWVIGHGQPVVVVNGGPGLGASYARRSLFPLASSCQLIFYDQIACGADTTSPSEATIGKTADQFARLFRLAGKGKEPGVIAHSWGTHVVLAAERHFKLFSPTSRLVFCNPCPLTKDRNDAAGARLLHRVPPSILDKIGKLDAKGDDPSGARLMELALPYYCALAPVPDLPFDYRIPTYNAAMSSTGNFTLVETAAQIPGNITVVIGEQDYIIPADTTELQQRAGRTKIVPKAGHFAFAEVPEPTLTWIATGILG